jgi:hypothetical protein
MDLRPSFRPSELERSLATSRRSPVLDREAADAFELRGVVRHQRELEGAGMRCDEQVVGADQGASFLQIGADLGVVESGVVGEVQRLDVGEERRQRGGVLRARGETSTP